MDEERRTFKAYSNFPNLGNHHHSNSKIQAKMRSINRTKAWNRAKWKCVTYLWHSTRLLLSLSPSFFFQAVTTLFCFSLSNALCPFQNFLNLFPQAVTTLLGFPSLMPYTPSRIFLTLRVIYFIHLLIYLFILFNS